ncbi:MAG TPA: glycosyltransferase family 39 protein [Steroidobacteraceae bacterium]|nr:glycosyltransferase family 39 protein [Steroidobacteraceae bacterium]
MSSHAAASAARLRSIYIGMAVLVGVLWLAMLPLRPLFNPDEGRYAEIPREMLAGGDWIIPHLNGLAYVEKPPLQYWATALSLALFGKNEFAARLYTALSALGAILITALAARRLWGGAAASRAGAVLAGTLLFVVMGQLLTLDMSLTLYMTLALAAFLAAQSADRPQAQRGWMLLVWAATALGMLTKGLVAGAIPAAVLVLYSAYSRDLGPWRRLHVGLGLPLFLAIAVPWFWLAARRLPDFLEFFFVHEHLARYLTPSADRQEVWWFFGPVFLLGSLPWTLSALRVLFLGWPRLAEHRGFDAALFLKIWVWFVCLFFSLSDSKLMPYILPAMPAVALLIASLPESVLGRDLSRTAMASVVIALALGVVCMLAPHHIAPSDRSRYFLALARPLAEIALVLAVSGLYVLSRRRRDATTSAVFLGAGWCLSGLLIMRGAAAVAPIYSGIEIARAFPEVPRDSPIYSIETYDQTLPFYWGRTVELVSYRGELDYGLERDPGAELPTVAQFVERWNRDAGAFALMEKPMFDELSRRGVPMREVAHDVGRVLAARR